MSTDLIPRQFQAKLNGHTIDTRKADRFFSGKDGRQVTDEEWDEDRRRAIENTADESLVETSKVVPIGNPEDWREN